MFGLSWGQILLILLVGVFVLGPERIPTTIRWVLAAAQKARSVVSGARQELLGDFGPEIAELRRQIAELQSVAGISGRDGSFDVIRALTAQPDGQPDGPAAPSQAKGTDDGGDPHRRDDS